MRIFLLSLMLFVSKFIFAQTKYDTWVKLSSSPSSILRYIHTLKDSSIVFSKINQSQSIPDQLVELKVSEITSISFQREGTLATVTLVGVGLGLGVGYLVGRNLDRDYKPCVQGSLFCFDEGPHFNAIIFSGIGALAGAGIGVTLGSIKSTYNLNGSYQKYREKREYLEEFRTK